MARQHGTRSCYAAGCRRPECTRANSEAGSRRNRLIAYGRWQPRPLVDAGPAREHLLALAAEGTGWRQAARQAGLPVDTVRNLLYPRGARGRVARTSPRVAAAVLAVRTDPALLPGSVCVDAVGTRRRLQALVALGWSQRRLAAMLGVSPQSFGHLIHDRDQVTAATFRAVRDLYDRLWNTAPPAAGPGERISVSRALRASAARGWPPPGAWDDDLIDDPAASPAPGWRRPSRRRPSDLAAEARELARYGLSRAQAAERLGVSRNTLDQAMARHPAPAGEKESVA